MENSNQQRIKDITERLETGIRELYESDRYRSYLSTMSRFHKYSVNNTLLIHLQMPNATLVAGFNTWKNKFGRYVKRGEKGIQVIAPATSQRNVREPALDKDTKEPILDAAGNAVMEEHAVRITRFKPVTVFDVSQTDGNPLPKLAQTLNGSVEQYDAFLEAVRRSAPVPIEFEPMAAGTDGYFSADDQRIAIRDGMSQVQTISAIVHEVAHSKLHDYDRIVDAETPITKDRRTEEVEAESISYSVCQYYGIETAENSLGYIASWSKSKDLKELKTSLETIQKTASVLIDDIDRNFAAICKERGIDMASPELGDEKITPVKEPEPVVAEPARAQAEAPESVANTLDPYLAYASAVCDHAEELGRAGLIVLPFGDHDKETFAQMYADTLRSGLQYAKEVLDDYAEQSGYPTPEKLYQMLNELKAYRDSTLTYTIRHHELNPSSSFISSYLPDGQVDQNILFFGSTELCNRVLSDLQAGILSTDQVQSLSRMSDEGATEEELQAAIDSVLGRSDELPSEPPQEPPALQTLDTYPRPDYAVFADALPAAGCNDAELLPLTRDRAQELFAEGFSIYVIENGEPMMCFDEADITGPDAQIFAVEKFEWEKSQEFRITARDWRIEHQAEREAAFLQYPGDAFAIYQVRDNSPQHRDRLFTDLHSLKQLGMEPSREHYDLIYTGSLADHPSVTSPEAAYRVFNLEHPRDFAGHSLSVSDIVAFRRNGVVTYHYCDSVGFTEIPDFPLSRDLIRADQLLSDAIKTQGYFRVRSAVNQFQDADGMVSKSAMLRHYYGTDTYDDLVSLLKQQENYLKNAEMAMEDDYNMIDGIINNGPNDQRPPKQEPSQPEAPKPRPAKSDVPREKKSDPPSLLARLRNKQEEVEEQKRQKAQIAEICASIS